MLLSNSTIHILGDYNIDLLNSQCNIAIEFENIVISSGYTPLISTHTHNRNNCKKTCIDNILTNDPDRTILSGTIIADTHHRPIFQLSFIDSSTYNNAENKSKIYYDYSYQNIEKLCWLLQASTRYLDGILDFESFTSF